MQTELVTSAQRGDVEAFSELTATCIRRLMGAARLILRREDEAADAVQDALLQAWLDLPGLRDPDRFDAWVHRLLVRACYKAARRSRTRDVVEVVMAHPTSAGKSDEETIEVRDQLDRGFQRLSTEHRAVLVLHHYLGLSLLESAYVLRLPLGTVQSRLNRATQNMRAALEADERSSMPTVEALR